MTGPLGDDGWPTDDAVADDTRAEKALEARLAAPCSRPGGAGGAHDRDAQERTGLCCCSTGRGHRRAEGPTRRRAPLAAADRAADLASLQAFATSLTTLAVGAVDRARSGADTVQKASAAIVTIYTGILGFVFVASDNPLPTRGVLAPVFLGAAVVLSTAYLAYVDGREASTRGPEAVGGVEPKVLARVNATVAAAASAISTRRSYALRASVVALGVGLVYIVLPFVDLGSARAATPSAVASLPPGPHLPSARPRARSRRVRGAGRRGRRVTDLGSRGSVPAPDVDDSGVVAFLLLAGLAAVVVVPAAWGRPTST